MPTLLAISPHPDDAILSYGGCLAEAVSRGESVIIYTVFAGSPRPPYSPAAAEFHAMWDLRSDPMRPRLDEDRLAMEVLGATPIYGDFLDAIYRRDESGEWVVQPGGDTDSYLFGGEPRLVADIAAAIGQLIAEFRPARVVTCSALGDHVDHVRSRDAAIVAATLAGSPLRFWEDLPYGLRTDRIPPLVAGAFRSSRVEPVTGAAWRTKIKAVECYRSQHQMLVADGRSIMDSLCQHARVRASKISADFGERVWEGATGGGTKDQHHNSVPEQT